MATMLPIGLELPGEPSVPEMMATASLAEQLGYESIWLTETRFTRDAITTTCGGRDGYAHARELPPPSSIPSREAPC